MTADLDELLTDPETARDPYDLYRRLRDDDPLYECAPLGCWVVSRHADAQVALAASIELSSAGRVVRDRVPPAYWSAFAGFDGLFWSDPPDYDERRRR